MKGVILAGGKATRLRPLTLVTNKHLLPIYNKPMIYYPLESMKRAGIEEVLIVTNPEHAGQFINLFRSGREFGLRFFYEIQDEPGGLSQGVGLAESFAEGEKILAILGDNIFTHDLSSAVKKFERREKGAMIFAKEVENAKEYGVVELNDLGKVLSIVEKPEKPKSRLAQTGIYMYDKRVFDLIRSLEPSARGELEITDLNNRYAAEGTLECEVIPTWWVDAGTSFDDLLRANQIVAEIIRKEGQKAP